MTRKSKLFGGSCGLTPRRRCQPGSGATRAEPVFPTKREGQRGGAAGTPWRLRRSCHLAQLASRFVSRLASQQCTQMPQNGPERPFSAICVHYCVLASVHNSTTVYTNAPKRRGEAQSSHLCTLLRSQGHSQPKLTAQQCTQMPQNGAERPFPPICVHSCVVALAVRPTPSGR